MSQRYTGTPTWKKVAAGAVAAAVAATGIGAAVHYAANPSWMAWTPPTPIPGTATATPTATATNTPTATQTPVPPTATNTPGAATPTNTPGGATATATNTPTAGAATATLTPIPTATGTYTTGVQFTPGPTPTANAMATPNMQEVAFVGPPLTPQPTATFVAAATATPNPNPQFADLYIAPTGVDTTAHQYCTDSLNPCKSLRFAMQFAQPGFTVHLASGYYGPQWIPQGVGGTQAQPIVIAGPTDNSAIIEHPYPASDAEQQLPLLNIIQSHWLTFQYLTVVGMRTGRDDFNAAKYNNGSDETTNCAAYDYPLCQPSGAEIIDQDGGDTDYPGIGFDHMIVEHTAGSCFKLTGNGFVTNSLLIDCGFNGNTWQGTATYGHDNFVHGIYVTVGNVTVSHNTIVGASAYGITVHTSGAATDNVVVDRNDVSGSFGAAAIGSDAAAMKVWISNNLVHDVTAPLDAIQLAAGNVAYGNVLWNDDGEGKFGMTPHLGGQYLYNNTLYSNACCGSNETIRDEGGNNVAATGPITLENNLFAEPSGTFKFPWNELFNTTPYTSGNLIDYNLYDGPNPYPYNGCTNASGGSCSGTNYDGGHSPALRTDPQFTTVNATPTPSNLIPQTTSPAKDAGTNVGLAACPDGRYPIGAYCPP